MRMSDSLSICLTPLVPLSSRFTSFHLAGGLFTGPHVGGPTVGHLGPTVGNDVFATGENQRLASQEAVRPSKSHELQSSKGILKF